MNAKKTLIAFGVMALVLSIAVAAMAAGVPDPNKTNYAKTIVPLGNGYGIARITTTESSTDPLYDFRLVSGGAISSGKLVGGLYKVYGAQLGFGANGGYTDNDLTAFNLTIDPANSDVLSVWRNRLWTSFHNGVADIGLGGVSSNGVVSVRVDGYGGTLTGSAIGAFNGLATITAPAQLASYSPDVAGVWTRMCGGSADTQPVSTPTIGNEDDLQSYSSYSNFTACGRSNLIPSGSSTSNAHCENTATGATRATISTNSASHTMAQYAKAGSDVTDKVTMLRYIKYTDNGTTIAVNSRVDYSFANAIPGRICSGVNFFGSTTYRGPEPISINDLGDVSFPVVVVDPGFSGSWRTVIDHAILFMDHTTPGVFKVVCANYDGKSAPALFYDNWTAYAPCMSVALDNSKNVFFEYTNWMGSWGGDIKSTICIYQASANSSTSPTAWSVKPIIWLGQQWKDVEDNITYSLAQLFLGNTGSEWFINPACFAHKNLNRTGINGAGIGGFMLSAGLGGNFTGGLKQCACYVSPTTGQPNAKTIADARVLADNEGINLLDLTVQSELDDTTDNNGYIWKNYLVSDRFGSTIRVETIRHPDGLGRSGLTPGYVIHASGTMKTDTGTGERYLHSSGLVLVSYRQPYGMNNRTIAAGGIAVGKWARTWGVAHNVDSTAKTFTVDDGSGPITVDYSAVSDVAPIAITAPANGAFVSVSGKVTAAGVLSQYDGDSVN